MIRSTTRTLAPPPLASSLRVPTAGQPLPAPLRASMEAALHHDFSSIRIHENARPSAIGARALARGNHIHFNLGEYRPHTSEGRHVLAHELAHVVQQRQGRVRTPLSGGAPVAHDPRLEAEADRTAASLQTGAPPAQAPLASHDHSPPAPVAQPMLSIAARAAAGGMRRAGGGGFPPPRPPGALLKGHYIDAPLLPFIQRRYAHVGLQGSGVAQEDESSVKALHDAYEGEHKALIGGPGKSAHDPVEWPFLGALQTRSGQDERIRDAMRLFAEARLRGDSTIHISGHSRGGGNALLLAQYIHQHGIVHPDTGQRVAPPGTPIDSLTLFDAVPHMGGAGHATALDEHGDPANVPYEALAAPSSVRFLQHLFAGGERRDQFRQADIPASSPETDSVHAIVPNARHNEVGGRPGGNPDAIALSISEALRNLRARGLPFAGAGVLGDAAHNAALERLMRTAPDPGVVERLIATVGGEGQRRFPPYAQHLVPRPLPSPGPAPYAGEPGREEQYRRRVERMRRKLAERQAGKNGDE